MGIKDRIRSVVSGKSTVPTPSRGPEATLSGAAAEVAAALREQIASQSDGELTADEIPGQASLIEEGILDSLASVRLLTMIEERYGVNVDEADLVGRLHSLDLLAEHVAAARPGSSPE